MVMTLNDILEKRGEIREYLELFGSAEENIANIWAEQGKCTTYFKGIDTELKYYKKSLELFDKYNIDAILRQSNITPGKNYTYQEISDAVLKGINGKTPIIQCGHIDEVNIDNPFQRKDRCKRDQLIYYQGTQDYINCDREFEFPRYSVWIIVSR
ncbi:Similar to rnaset2: Ribonuclease T2 (Danio rerio) [Cotesia congregata]|uniref:Similar to rnaset2: Ribonuclease T2 (Danio rerio) n=1 Tax=Cotesia congregata TaxID=51543 RepID=A0A8J2EG55_COTCN|nr:Similar to rnaset2: Ribonuclease T2 (Danio rerio) [Cotesia congregata]